MSISECGRLKRSRLSAITLLLCMGAAFGSGCSVGSGSAGPAATATVEGTLISSETEAPPTSAATVSAGGQTVQAAANDGTFTLANVPTNTTTFTIIAPGEKTRTLPLTLTANGTDSLGDVFLSSTGYTATLNGTVDTIVNGTTKPVPNATVTIGNVTTTTGANGAFTISGLPIGLGSGLLADTVYGSVTAPNYLARPVTSNNLTGGLKDGANTIQPIYLAASASTVPGAPFNISGQVTVAGKPGTGISLVVTSGGSTLGTVSPDSTGTYTLWAIPGTYTITATYQGQTKQQTVTLLRADKPVLIPTISF